MSGRCDPAKVKRIAAVLTDLIPNATVTHRDLGDFAGVEYTITHPRGPGWFQISHECFEDRELSQVEDSTRQAATKLGPGGRWQLDSTGTLTAK